MESHHRKEMHLLSGLGVQILIVGLLVFAYTQAIRQVKLQRETFHRLQEQLTMAREQKARQGPTPDLALMQAQIQKIRPAFLTPVELAPQLDQIRALAEKDFHLRGTRWKKSDDPADSFAVTVSGRADFKVDLYGLEMEGAGSARSAAGLLASLGPASEPPVFPLQALELKADPSSSTGSDVQVSCRWFIPVITPLTEDKTALERKPRAARAPAWGWREELFLSPLSHPNALRVPAEKNASLRLTGILWDPAHPTCVINGKVFRPGEKAGDHLVVLITERAVLLEGPAGEILLRQS